MTYISFPQCKNSFHLSFLVCMQKALRLQVVASNKLEKFFNHSHKGSLNMIYSIKTRLRSSPNKFHLNDWPRYWQRLEEVYSINMKVIVRANIFRYTQA